MRWYSTVESVQEGEISILAIVETVVAVSVSLGIFLVYGYYWHIVVGACVAPFLLLRTEYSTELGLKWFAKTEKLQKIRLPAKTRSAVLFVIKTLAAFVMYSIFVAVTSILIKTLATSWSFIKNPITTVTSIPSNWYRTAITADTMHPPEIVPGIETSEDKHFEGIKWRYYSSAIRSVDWLILESFFSGFFLILFIVPIQYGPAILYRFSLKSTSLIYAPLIWIVSSYRHVKKDLNIYLADSLESQYEYIKRIYAAFVLIFLFAIPLYVLIQWSLWTQQWLDNELVNYFLPLKEIDSWHITRFWSALITILLWWYADKLKIRLNMGNQTWVPSGTLIIGVALRVRDLCSLWTLFCGLYIVYTIVDWNKLPSIRWLPF